MLSRLKESIAKRGISIGSIKRKSLLAEVGILYLITISDKKRSSRMRYKGVCSYLNFTKPAITKIDKRQTSKKIAFTTLAKPILSTPRLNSPYNIDFKK
jgi:hypothetical protein